MIQCLFIRVDAGGETGLGHLARVSVFADYAKQLEIPVKFLVGNTNMLPEAVLRKYECIQIGNHESESADAIACESIVSQRKNCLILLDSYKLGKGWESKMQCCGQVMVIDDLKRQHAYDSFLLDYFPTRAPQDYPDSNPNKLMLGLKYFPISNNLQHRLLKKRSGLLLSFGGGAGNQFALECLKVLHDQWNEPLTVTWLGGKYSSLSWWKNSSINITCIEHTSHIEDLYFSHQVCLGAGGVSQWERIWCQLPSLVWQVADNQLENFNYLREASFSGVEPISDLPTENSDWLNILDKWLNQSPALPDIGISALATERVFEKLMNYEQELDFKVYSKSLFRALYQLQVIPGIREHFNNPEKPTWQEHLDWSMNLMNSENRRGWLVYYDDNAIGWLQLVDEQGSEQVSILIDPEYQGRGFGTKILEYAKREAKFGVLTAQVKEENLVSKALFCKQGYKAVSKENYQWELS